MKVQWQKQLLFGFLLAGAVILAVINLVCTREEQINPTTEPSPRLSPTETGIPSTTSPEANVPSLPPEGNGVQNPPTQTAPSVSQPTTQELRLTILELTSKVQAGSQAKLHILTAPTALANVEVVYPLGSKPVQLDEVRIGPEGEHSWIWVVPPNTPSGEATLTVTSSVVGKTLTATDTFSVCDAPCQ